MGLSVRTRIATDALCHLTKTRKVKLRVIEDTVGELAKGMRSSNACLMDACGAVAWVFVHMFPVKQTDATWGWAHPAWTWNLWWDFVARCLHLFLPSSAFSILRTALEIMLSQEPAGLLLCELPTWQDNPKCIQELRRRLFKTSGLSAEELLRELDHLGLDKAKVEPQVSVSAHDDFEMG